MQEINTKNGIVKIFATTIEDEAIAQIIRTAESPLGVNSQIRIMPDGHFGAGCCIGTTMKVIDKVCPNLVGVDIACSVRLVKTDIDFNGQLEKLDKCIRKCVPSGFKKHNTPRIETEWFDQLRCVCFLKKEVIRSATLSLGTLGGGNHFIEAYDDGYVCVHTGSRNIGLCVAQHYQHLAITQQKARTNEQLSKANAELSYLEGEDKDDYIHDIKIIQEFAKMNRTEILAAICIGMKAKEIDVIDCSHNYIDTDTMILRKGATDAGEGKQLLIPLNMRDGLLICSGKGNPDWNYSAPHGAGRLYGRSKAKQMFSVSDYKKTMEGIYSTCINSDTLDEAPFVYKDWEEIAKLIEPTAEIEKRLIPIYNYKAGKE
ncbi:MAG: RtcB family protein [Christensenellaceae bacterium]|jgi:RNA-splicing ligase RtcB|nr:RtcB family protein [Christensenellaceae bacterium]